MAAYCHLGIYALRTFSRNDMDVVQSTSQPLSYLLIDPPLRAFSLSIDISERLNGGGGRVIYNYNPNSWLSSRLAATSRNLGDADTYP